MKIDGFGPRLDPTSLNWTQMICRGNQPAVHDLLTVGLDQRDLAVEIGFFLRMELEGNAAGRCDALQHRERVPRVFCIFQAGNH